MQEQWRVGRGELAGHMLHTYLLHGRLTALGCPFLLRRLIAGPLTVSAAFLLAAILCVPAVGDRRFWIMCGLQNSALANDSLACEAQLCWAEQ